MTDFDHDIRTAGTATAAPDPRTSIYGEYATYLPQVMDMVVSRIEDFDRAVRERTGEGAYEHFNHRIKGDASMREKCDRKGLPQTPFSALHDIHDAIGCRIVCSFVDDVYALAKHIEAQPEFTVLETKDYVRRPKPNGYRSYHMIVSVETPFPDVTRSTPGHYPVEIQLRTIAMDSWAALEHQVKYKKDLGNANVQIITQELKRCADELASCDLQMQTIRNLINENR
ncbi:GTP pyrophosphokinase [Pseudoscardovia radai]|uniref:GTP pyrophosphokinase n=1 Tax=Pseudoscardovia radai TaxID=987066 RepID=A0A261EUD8_9BIFI|nr:GTP pyrophosphokinase [Pseudoscardovia radai]OZG50481.1 GTP pyrophosphokinase [Pseudoscardovia radai]